MYLPSYQQRALRGLGALAGWGPEGTYTGPLYPQVHENGDGTRDVVYNAEQVATCPVAHYWEEPYPRIRRRDDLDPDAYELLISPGVVRQGRLNATGTVIQGYTMVNLPMDCRPNEHPTVGSGETPPPEWDPYDLCGPGNPNWLGERVVSHDPLTGEVFDDIFSTPEGCAHRYLWDDGNHTPLRREEWPFHGAACFRSGGIQGPCPDDPNRLTQAAGTGVYQYGTLDAPVAPWRHPESPWYGHRVMGDQRPAWLDDSGDPTGAPTGPAQPPPPEEEPGPDQDWPIECWLGKDENGHDVWDRECLIREGVMPPPWEPPPPGEPEGPIEPGEPTGPGDDNGGGGGGGGGDPTTTPDRRFPVGALVGLGGAGLALFLLADDRERDR